jgi:hypothetical protein
MLGAGILILAAGGCGSKKKIVGPGPDEVYLAPTSPSYVLQNLVKAYNARDSIETKAVYDVAYQGSSNDPALPAGQTHFTQATEVSHVRRLHDDRNIVNVSLDLGPASLWQVLPGNVDDGVGAKIIPIQYQLLTLDDASSATYQTNSRSQIEFAFKPTETAPGDTVWTVIRWTETVSSSP